MENWRVVGCEYRVGRWTFGVIGFRFGEKESGFPIQGSKVQGSARRKTQDAGRRTKGGLTLTPV
jgi:hypothetical protein